MCNSQVYQSRLLPSFLLFLLLLLYEVSNTSHQGKSSSQSVVFDASTVPSIKGGETQVKSITLRHIQTNDIQTVPHDTYRTITYFIDNLVKNDMSPNNKGQLVAVIF